MKVQRQTYFLPVSASLDAQGDARERQERDKKEEQKHQEEDASSPSLQEKVQALNEELKATSLSIELETPSQGLRLKLKTKDGKEMEHIPMQGFRGRLIDRKA